jgi:proton-translocating NADH-quinone oxidoreductase chain N
MNASNALIWLVVIPLGASPLIYLVGRISARRTGQARPALWLALLAVLATAYPLFYVGRHYLASGVLQFAVSKTVSLRFDGIALLLAVTVLALSAMVILFSGPYMAGEEGEEKYYALLSAMVGTIIGLGCAGDLFNMWVWFEAMAVTSYMLVAFYRHQPGSLEAGVKYLVQSATGSVLVLLGIALVFGQTGQLDLVAIRASIPGQSPMLLAAGALFLIGFGVKTAIVPMHTWLPDAHSQAPSGISAMLSGIVIESGLVALLKATGALSPSSAIWGSFLLGFGAINMLVGNLMALRQTQVKRLLAYSSLSHIGYILLGLGIAITFNQADGAAGSFFHLFNHALMKGLAFLAAGAFLYVLHVSQGDHDPLTIIDLNGASRKYPLTAFTLSIALLALGGLPPLAGFMSKWQIFVAGIETRNTVVLILVIFAALNSVLSLGYYAPLVNRMYRHEPSQAVLAGKPVSVQMGIPLLLLTLAIVILGFWPTLLSWLTNPAATSLLAIFGH